MGKASRKKRDRDAEKAARLAELAALPNRPRARTSKHMSSARDADMRILAELDDARRRREAVDIEIRGLAAHANETGISWGLIGGALGITRQSARERYGRE